MSTIRETAYRIRLALIGQTHNSVEGVNLDIITQKQAESLARAQRVLHRWAEMECGDSGDLSSWCISRDETTGKTYREVHPHKGTMYRERIRDAETAALNSVREVCGRAGIFFFHQTDPRGCSLYVSTAPLYDTNYTNGVACL